VYESHNGPLNAQFSQSTSSRRWGDVVKGPSMSRNDARDYSLLRKPFSILDTREWRSVSVDLPLRYACCASESRLGLMVSLIWMTIGLAGSSTRRKRD